MLDPLSLPDNVLTTQLKKVVNWARRSSLWPLPFATACCGIEVMATASSRYDLARFGAEAMRFSPRQSDLLIVAGRVGIKMMPILQHIYQQMTEPKWVISMGACASTGGVFDAYARRFRESISSCRLTFTFPGCPPRPETLIEGIMAHPANHRRGRPCHRQVSVARSQSGGRAKLQADAATRSSHGWRADDLSLIFLQSRCESGAGETFPDGIFRQFGHAIDVKLFHQVAPVRFGGLDADAQHRRHLFGGFALGDQLQHFPLAR